MFSKKIIYIDTETTGLIKYVHGIIQLAYIIEIDGVVKKRGSFKINPLTYKRKTMEISPKALEVNGYKEEQFKDFRNSLDACSEFVQILANYVNRFDRNDYFTVIGYMADFDIGFVQEWMKDSGFDSYFSYFSIHSLDPYQILKWLTYNEIFTPINNSLSLVNTCGAIGLELDAHDAVADIEATRDLFNYIQNHYYIPEPLKA